ncbi:MAG: hypothetical protein WC449_02515 [Candidatus Paceibacterota bacterium]
MPRNPEKSSVEKEAPIVEKTLEQWFSPEGILEKHELTLQEQEIRRKLEQDVLKYSQSTPQAPVQPNDVKILKKEEAQGKIKKLLTVATTQNLYAAVELAKKTKDPYLIDLFHDILAKDQLYLKFKKK